MSPITSTFTPSRLTPFILTMPLRSPVGRGVPDIAVQSMQYAFYMNGETYVGTSTAYSTNVSLTALHPPSALRCPSSGTRLSHNVQTAAAIFALLNDYRMSRGKNTLGWVNLWLYDALPLWETGAIKDIIGGYNGGCDTAGFFATAGWDPVRPAKPLFLHFQLSLIPSSTGHRPRVAELFIPRN